MGADYTPGPAMFVYQPPEVLNQAAPVMNQWYQIGDDINNGIVYGIGINVEDVGETLECRATIDGEVMDPIAIAAVHSNTYAAFTQLDAILRTDHLTFKQFSQIGDRPWLFMGRHIVIEVRKTTNAGAGNLTGIVTWGQLD